MSPQRPIGPASDDDLPARIARGDQQAFERLMRLHNRTLFRTARAILRDDAEAEDALQEAYLHAYRSIKTFRGDAKLSTWLVRIVANEALGRRRKQVRRAAVVPINGLVDVEMAATLPAADEPEQQAGRTEIRGLLEAGIDALPDAFRAVFMLRAVEELSVEETAAILDIPPATVRTRFFRARSQLREALAQEIDLALEDAFAFAGQRCDRIVSQVFARLNETTLQFR
jgi:RNA polymerase sigma-70 factor, ECF subfamily